MELETLQPLVEMSKQKEPIFEYSDVNKNKNKLRHDDEFTQLKNELYSLLFEFSCVKKENEELKEQLKNQGSYQLFKEKMRPQTANLKVEKSYTFDKLNKKEEEDVEEEIEEVDEELDDLLRKSATNLKNLKEEVQYLQSQTTANSDVFKKINVKESNEDWLKADLKE